MAADRARRWRAGLWLAGALLAAPLARAGEVPMVLETGRGQLHGSLMLPTAGQRCPAVLIVAGSGPTDRDGNTVGAAGRNDSLRLLAAALAEAGYASLRYDKRGVGASQPSGPRESELRFDAYVNDARAWIDRLARDPRVDGVAVLGHSEGALIGLLAAERTRARAFVSVAGPAQRASDLLREQLKGRLPPELARRSDQILAALEQGHAVSPVPPELAVLYRESVQRYLISWFQYVPHEVFGRLRVPALIVQGDTDVQVGVPEAQALKDANPRAVLQVVPGMNHVLKAVPADPARQPAPYGDPALPLAPGLVEAVVPFLSAHLPPCAVGAGR